MISQIYFWNKTLHVSDSSSVHHQEFFTVHTAMVYVIQVCWQPTSLRAVSKHVWHIPLLCVRWKTPDDGQKNCLKHVEFCSKNKFEKSLPLVCFTIRIYHDARSSERQMLVFCCWVYQCVLDIAHEGCFVNAIERGVSEIYSCRDGWT